MNLDRAFSLMNYITSEMNRFIGSEFRPRPSFLWQKWIKDDEGYDWHLFFLGPGLFAAVRTLREIEIKTDIDELESKDIDHGIIFKYDFKRERYVPTSNSLFTDRRVFLTVLSHYKKAYREVRKQYLQ